MVSCCEGCRVFFLLFPVPLPRWSGGGGADPPPAKRAPGVTPPRRRPPGICVSCGELCKVNSRPARPRRASPSAESGAGVGGWPQGPPPAPARPPRGGPGLPAAAAGAVSWPEGAPAGARPGAPGAGRGVRRYLLLSYCPGRRAGRALFIAVHSVRPRPRPPLFCT